MKRKRRRSLDKDLCANAVKLELTSPERTGMTRLLQHGTGTGSAQNHGITPFQKHVICFMSL